MTKAPKAAKLVARWYVVTDRHLWPRGLLLRPPPCRKPDLEDSRRVLVIDGALLSHGRAVGALAQGDELQPKQGTVSPGSGPNQGHLELAGVH